MMINLFIFLTVILATALATAKEPSRARRQAQRQESCKSQYSIGGTAPNVIVDGKLVYPDSKDQCQYGVELLAEDTPDIKIKCCVKKRCGPGLVGVCQNQHKQCKGSIVVYVVSFFLFLFLFIFVYF